MKDILQYFEFRTAISLGIVTGFFQAVLISYGFFSSSPEKPPARNGYLAFQSPPKLRFHEIDPQADRRKLRTLEAKGDALASAPTAPVANPENSFPLISYGEDNNQSPSSYEIPLVDQGGDFYPEPALPPNHHRRCEICTRGYTA